MTGNERLWDDSAITPMGEDPPPPHTLGMLLATLRLGREDEHTRRVEISRWLQSNAPSRRLVRSLER